MQTVREELQRFLEDDDDMMKMCLTRKKELEQMTGANLSLPSLTVFRISYTRHMHEDLLESKNTMSNLYLDMMF